MIEPGTDNELIFIDKYDDIELMQGLECQGVLSGVNIEPSHNLIFHNKDEEVGRLDFVGSELKFTGNVDKATESFMEFLCSSFQQRIDQIVDEKAANVILEFIEEVKESDSNTVQKLIEMYHNSISGKNNG